MKRNIKIVVAFLILIFGVAGFVGGISRAFSAPKDEITRQDLTFEEAFILKSGEVGYLSQESASGELPTRIRIPTINVDSKVQIVGISLRGNMAVPTNYRDVGWYKYGVIPGSLGSAVMNGHYDNSFGFNAVFKDLSKLRHGDQIIVTVGGKEKKFIVTRVESYTLEEIPLEEIFNNSDAARLNLITCAGEWDETSNMYSERLVVYSVLEPET